MTSTPPLDLDAIQARADAATPGPWGVYQYGGDSLIEIAADLEDTGTGYSARRTIARFDEEPLDNDPGHREWTAEEDWAQVQADAAYIAAMPPEVTKALVAEVRRLRDKAREYGELAARRESELIALRAELATARNPHTPRLCKCGHSHRAHTAPAPHSCFAFGKTCPCKAYRQLPHDEAVAQLERNRQAAAERAAVLPPSGA
ncbi:MULTISPECIES: hypothetical protein [Streptomyces]|uniref:hypothetical protein n=1 Tax=Streptomyces TaxID=1883 RepID=UPI00073DFB86|nr:hypothetical protein [Streptomyces sp. EAS-AB2608]MYU30659.1 hypothetical protein [Streptomyces sp. SID7810]BCM70903.1 hypothetical protein EASAB2608_06237 [Streptomyces sp. EAS-AB2608]CUW31732.1 hypothetical protein TUE45_06481 [Streptomyces reticuli]